MNLNFGQALEALKQGEALVRSSWRNGYHKQFVFMRPSDELNKDFIVNTVKSLPKCVKDWFAKSADDDVDVKFSGYLCLKDENENIINGWLPSQADLIATDWRVLDISNEIWHTVLDKVSAPT